MRDGLCETSVRDIAKASGFTNPAMFKHFRSKDQLAGYLFDRCHVELVGLISDAIASEFANALDAPLTKMTRP